MPKDKDGRTMFTIIIPKVGEVNANGDVYTQETIDILVDGLRGKEVAGLVTEHKEVCPFCRNEVTGSCTMCGDCVAHYDWMRGKRSKSRDTDRSDRDEAFQRWYNGGRSNVPPVLSHDDMREIFNAGWEGSLEPAGGFPTPVKNSYIWLGLDARGLETSGNIRATSKEDAINQIRKRGIYPTQVQLEPGSDEDT